MKKLEALQAAVRKAETDMISELKKRWPKGSLIDVFLHSRQQVPTTMTVMSHDGQGCVRAYMDSKTARYGGRYVREIHFTKIL